MADSVLLNGKTVSEKERNYGIDLLRVISMFMVVLLHLNKFSDLLKNYEANTIGYIGVWALEAFAICAVNVYAMISGYVLLNSKFKLKRLLQLYLEVLFFSLISYVLMAVIKDRFFGFKDFIKGLVFILPLSGEPFWYFKAYFLLFFVFPLLNILAKNMNKRQFILLFIVVTVCVSFIAHYAYDFGFNAGYSFIWLVVMYLLGAYFKKYGLLKTSGRKNILLYVLFSVIILLILIINNALPPIQVSTEGNTLDLKYDSYAYTSVFVVFQSIFLFNAFAKIKLRNDGVKKITLKLSQLTFGIYVVHCSLYGRALLKFASFIGDLSPWLTVPLIFGLAIAYFAGFALIAYLKQLLFKYAKIDDITFKVGDFIQNKISAFADKKAEE